MKKRAWVAPTLCALSLPLVWVAVVATWGFIDSLTEARQVHAFIRNHEGTVTELRLDPDVHELTLKATGSFGTTLAITVDVEDKTAFDKVDKAISDTDLLAIPPQWHITVRSQEDLGNNYGSAMWPFQFMSEATHRIVIAAVVATIVCAFLTWHFCFYHPKKFRTARVD